MIRVWWPGVDPMENSHRRNMALIEKGVRRTEEPSSMRDQSREHLRELEDKLRAGQLP